MQHRPWHLRIPTLEQEQWYGNLREIHQMNTSWITAFQLNFSVLSAQLGRKTQENLWMIPLLPQAPLKDLIEESSADEALKRLDRSLHHIQALIITHLLQNASPAPGPQLEALSSESGMKCAQNRWIRHRSSTSFQHLRSIWMAVQSSPFAGGPGGRPLLLLKRLQAEEAQIERPRCPHYEDDVSLEVAHLLCATQSAWIKGYVQALRPQTEVIYSSTPDLGRAPLQPCSWIWRSSSHPL
jgi:hypothetical protein